MLDLIKTCGMMFYVESCDSMLEAKNKRQQMSEKQTRKE
jgi:hypothetical protein